MPYTPSGEELLRVQEGAMHVVIRQYQVAPDAVEVVTRRIRAGFAPYISAVMPGFVEYSWIDAGDGVLISISIFAEETSARASSQVAAAYIREHLARELPHAPVVQAGEVLVRVVGAAGQDSA
jgi:hypothetical protein